MSHGINSRAVQRKLRGLSPISSAPAKGRNHGGRGRIKGLKGKKHSRRPVNR